MILLNYVSSVARAFVKSNDITKNSYASYLVTHVILCPSPSAILTFQYLDRKSSFVKMEALYNLSIMSWIKGIRYLFLFIYIFLVSGSPSVFFWNKTRVL